MKSKIIFIKLMLLSLLIFSCGSNVGEVPKDFDYGQIDDGIYINSFFGLKMNLPTEWFVKDSEQTKRMVTENTDKIVGDDKYLKEAMKAAEVNTAYLLAVFKYQIGAPVNFNPSISLIAENIEKLPGIKNGSDYLFHARKLIKQQTQVQYDYVSEEFNKISLDNQEFYSLDCTLNQLGNKVNQIYYSTVKNGFTLNIILTYSMNEEKIELEKIIKSIKFDK